MEYLHYYSEIMQVDVLIYSNLATKTCCNGTQSIS